MPQCADMTNITYSFSNGAHILLVEGHSGYAKCGRDIVCAGVSALVQALAKALRDLGEHVSLDIETDASRASYHITARAEDKYISYVNGAFDVALCGFKLLSSAYPENVNLNVNFNSIVENMG